MEESERTAVAVEEIAEIAALADPVLRNLRITLAYHELAVATARVLGRENVSWCAFGAWASNTAGRSIRGESAPAAVRAAVALARRAPAPLRPLGELPGRVVRQVAAHVADGNLLVFRDLGPLFADLVEEFGRPGPPGPVHGRAVERCVARLRPGPAEDGGQDLLVAAVHSYGRAFLAADPGERAEHVLLANLRVGLHEQIRLQQAIAGALAPPAGVPLLGLLRRSWEAVITRRLMDLALPAADFGTTGRPVSQRIGADVRGGGPAGTPFPAALTRLRNVELKALLYDIDRTPNTLAGSAAADWALLGDRMNFVADLFRSRQQEQSLLRAPFTAEQAAAIRRGAVPAPGPW
ncbi:hypothetical protein ACIQBJ_13435 [Kitasatospora sp. NPDC088391]|uniref:hypothetical protein n=1 Tax=Kitasatospora sp. NPDC088391 TaxID=3364074 RepID=UPI0038184026